VRNSPTIQQLMQQKAQLTAQRAQLLATLLPSHPNVAAVAAQILAIDHQIGIEGRRVADALDAEAKIESSLLDRLQSSLADIKTKQANATRDNVQLDALDREAKADRDLLESYMTRYRDAAARTDASSALPDVRVLTFATPSETPSAPKTTLILGAVGFVSLALQVGAILFGELLSGRALVEPGMQRGGAAIGDDATEGDADEPEEEPLAGINEDAEEGASETYAAAEPLEAVPAVEAVAPDEMSGRSLRTWFGKRARAVGSSLTSYEPPIAAEPVAAPAIAAAPAMAAPAPHSPADVEPFAPVSVAPAPAAPTARADAGDAEDVANARRLANLSADLILGRARILVLAAVESPRDAELLAARLIDDAVYRGLSVARVDAGSFRPTSEPGITDLAANAAGFGDVVHKTMKDGLAEIPWGHLAFLDPDSSKPLTLVEALSDLYEVVIVLTGRVGPESSLPSFSALGARLVLVAAPNADPARVDAAQEQATSMGFHQIEAIAAPPWQAEVA
jgi:hypothetical protein